MGVTYVGTTHSRSLRETSYESTSDSLATWPCDGNGRGIHNDLVVMVRHFSAPTYFFLAATAGTIVTDGP
jgi:hypothetical protein